MFRNVTRSNGVHPNRCGDSYGLPASAIGPYRPHVGRTIQEPPLGAHQCGNRVFDVSSRTCPYKLLHLGRARNLACCAILGDGALRAGDYRTLATSGGEPDRYDGAPRILRRTPRYSPFKCETVKS